VKKLLIIYNYYHHYRNPVFESLGERFNLTVIHSDRANNYNSDKFEEKIIPVHKIGPFYLRPDLFKISFKDYDVIIILSDLRWVSSLFLFFLKRRTSKIILWGNWFTKSKFANKIRVRISKWAYSNVFYDYGTQLSFIEAGVPESKCFVANNTVRVNPPNDKDINNLSSIIAVGSLQKRKRIDLLIEAFVEIIPQIRDNITLDIIGSGVEEVYLKTKASDFKDRIFFHGQITDTDLLRSYYNKSICHVSFAQAGLSVLQSLGNATPFITKKDSITGGERYNIVDGYNGFLIEGTKEDLKDKLNLLCNDLSLAKTMGDNALKYYNQYCSITNMVQGFVDSIEFTQTSIIDERI